MRYFILANASMNDVSLRSVAFFFRTKEVADLFMRNAYAML